MDKSLLDLYADYLISSFGPTTATGLSRLLSCGLSHDKITRFLSERTFTAANLWQIVKPLVRQVQSQNAVLVIDDSIAHKPHTNPSALIGWHHDHTTGTSVKGITFVTTLYCTDDVSLPVAFALIEKDEEFTDKKTGKLKRRATVSKNEHCRAMLKACVKNGMPFRYVLNDVCFAAADNMKLIKAELGKDFVMPLKSNRNVALSEGEKTVAFRQSKRSHSNTAQRERSGSNRCLSRCFWSSRSLRTRTTARASCIWSRVTRHLTAPASWACTKNGGRSRSITSL